MSTKVKFSKKNKTMTISWDRGDKIHIETDDALFDTDFAEIGVIPYLAEVVEACKSVLDDCEECDDE